MVFFAPPACSLGVTEPTVRRYLDLLKNGRDPVGRDWSGICCHADFGKLIFQDFAGVYGEAHGVHGNFISYQVYASRSCVTSGITINRSEGG